MQKRSHLFDGTKTLCFKVFHQASVWSACRGFAISVTQDGPDPKIPECPFGQNPVGFACEHGFQQIRIDEFKMMHKSGETHEILSRISQRLNFRFLGLAPRIRACSGFIICQSFSLQESHSKSSVTLGTPADAKWVKWEQDGFLTIGFGRHRHQEREYSYVFRIRWEMLGPRVSSNCKLAVFFFMYLLVSFTYLSPVPNLNCFASTRTKAVCPCMDKGIITVILPWVAGEVHFPSLSKSRCGGLVTPTNHECKLWCVG